MDARAKARALNARDARSERIELAFAAGVGACLLVYALRADIALLCNATAELARLALLAVGVEVQRVGMQLQHSGGFRAEIGIECTALLPVVALWVALYCAGPALTHRLRTAVVGGALIVAANTLRIAHLSVLGIAAPGALWLWHSVIWHALTILLPVAVFALAARRTER